MKQNKQQKILCINYSIQYWTEAASKQYLSGPPMGTGSNYKCEALINNWHIYQVDRLDLVNFVDMWDLKACLGKTLRITL